MENTVDDQQGHLTRLGEPKELIKHCIHEDPFICYGKAIKLCDEEYGNPHRITCSYHKELHQWRNVKPNYASAYRRLYRFLLIRCQT